MRAQQIQSYEYDRIDAPSETPEWCAWIKRGDQADAALDAGEALQGDSPCSPEDLQRERQGFESRLGEEKRRAFAQGLEQGRREGREEEHALQTAERRAQQEQFERQLAAASEGFSNECLRYLREVEREAVELALGIAARVLRREARMDPLLLTGAVRVALGQLVESSELLLYVPERDVELWRQSLALVPNLPLRPEVVGDREMATGECRLESELGSVDLGLEAQLGEIENGFFDRGEERRSAAKRAAVWRAEKGR